LALAASARADRDIDAIELRVRTRDATEAVRNPAGLGPAERAAQGRLMEQSWTRERWILAGGTAVMVLEGGGHPLPDRTRIVLHESVDRADILRIGEQHVTLPLRALVDVLEGGRTRRTGYRLQPQAEDAADTESRWTRSLEYQARTAGWRRSVRARLTVWHRPAPAEEAVLGRMAFDLVTLPHLEGAARRILRREGAAVGMPTRWRLEVVDESRGTRAAAPVLEGEVLSAKHARVPESLIRAPGARRYEAIVHDAGGQLGGRALFAKVRSTNGPPGALRVANRTPFHVYVLADGALLGRVGPESEIQMDGLAPGYYRLYARSRYGTFAWGPRDQYVPGSMTVDLP